MMEFSEGSNIEKKINERTSIEEQGNLGKLEPPEFSDRKETIEEGKEEKKAKVKKKKSRKKKPRIRRKM
jgi:hypothetical protein